MKKLGDQYKKDTSYELDNALLQSTLKKMTMSEQTKSQPQRRLKMGIVTGIVAILALTATTGYAYVNEIGPFKSTYRAHTDKSVQNNSINQVITSKNLKVTVKNYFGDPTDAYISFDVETTDGSPLQTNEKDRQSEFARVGFNKVYLLCEGEKYDLMTLRTDDPNNNQKASYEAIVLNNFDGKEVELVFKDFNDEVMTTSDIGFKFNNLAELYGQATPATEKDFTAVPAVLDPEDDDYAELSKDPVAYYKFAAGQLHIPFSSQYPEAFVDNIGFHKMSGIRLDKAEGLFISITPGNEKNAEAIKNLGFKSIKENTPVNSFYGEGYEYETNQQPFVQEDGRIILLLENGLPGYTQAHLYSEHQTTAADLEHFTITTEPTYSKRAVYSGTMLTKIKMKLIDTTSTFSVDKSFSYEGIDMKVDEITLSNENLTIKSHRNDMKEIEDVATFIMKDGTEEETGPNGRVTLDGAVIVNEGQAGTDEYLITFTVPKSVTDPDQVAAVKVWGMTFELK